MENNKKINEPWWREGVIMFMKVSSYIVGPIFLASFIGNFFDKKNDSGNLYFYISIAVAFLATIYLIWKELKIYKKKIENQENKQK